MRNQIQNIAPLLADDFVDFEVNKKTRKEYLKLITDNSNQLGLYQKYLGVLHDSWVINTNITQDIFSITLNDFTTHVFADVINDKQKLKINHDKLVFPIQLDFGLISYSFNIVDEEGFILQIDPTSFDEYLSEQIISVNNDWIEIGLVVWKNGIKNERGQRLLILIKAKSILLTEFRDKAWIDIFSDKYIEYFEYFKSQFDKGRFLSDQSTCNKLIEEFDQMNNLR